MNRPMGIPAVDPLYADLRRHDPVRPALILDVRERDEFMRARIDGCLFIPMSQLGARLFEVPKDRPVLVICASGSRSVNVVGHLLGVGLDGRRERGRRDLDLGADGPAGHARPGPAGRGPAPGLTARRSPPLRGRRRRPGAPPGPARSRCRRRRHTYHA